MTDYIILELSKSQANRFAGIVFSGEIKIEDKIEKPTYTLSMQKYKYFGDDIYVLNDKRYMKSDFTVVKSLEDLRNTISKYITNIIVLLDTIGTDWIRKTIQVQIHST